MLHVRPPEKYHLPFIVPGPRTGARNDSVTPAEAGIPKTRESRLAGLAGIQEGV